MKTKLYLVIIPLIFFVSTIIFNVYKNNYEVLENSQAVKNTNAELVSIMLEKTVNSGIYESSSDNAWPTSGYTFNETLSKCENGGALSWNENKKTVILKGNISDKCYAYFDIMPPDITVAVTNKHATVGALANLNCSGATSTYNQKYNRIEISQINDKSTSCTLNYTNRTSKTYLNDKIIGLAGTTQGTGQVVNEKGYRYEGKNPNNWVWFNNELWRIIGVFDSETHGVTNTNLVKIIRANPIGGLAWNKSNTNDWANSSLYKLLNPVSGDSASGAYYNKQNGIGNEYCYSHSTRISGNCDYSNIGIDASYRNMIKEVTWKLGGHTAAAATAETFYTAERGTATVNNNAYAATKSGYIGLMYPSDYGYSVLASSCARTTNLVSYSKSSCAGQSWLGGQGYEWTIISNSTDSNFVFFVSSAGHLNGSSDAASYGHGVRPSLYLDDNVYVIDGTGSEADPFIIGM